MKLLTIPKDQYEDYRLDVIFDGYKWDPQFLDNNTIARHVLVLSKQEHQELKSLTESLSKETIEAETIINQNLNLTKKLGLSRKIKKDIKNMTNYDPHLHIRLMRYDFHPVVQGGWALSEVNSDVPGGFAEASLMPQIASKYFPSHTFTVHSFGERMGEAVKEKVRRGGRIMMVHCTSYSDDRQVMQFLGDQLKASGYDIIYGAADHLKFENTQAMSILDNHEGKIDGIIRFTPLEWLIDIKPKHWGGYFNTLTPSCNHPIAEFAQSKQFPLIWDDLAQVGVDLPTWKKLLPETVTVREAKGKEGFIYKPVWGRVGEGITIKEACRGDEYDKIMKDVRRHPKRYIAQKKFESKALIDDENKPYHVCLGAYSINGKGAGYYARISESPRIDSHAQDIPVLVEGE
ncbi:glutathionylspermidine synthase [Erysipelothrix larvae]|uniref:Glutathionylspermidine synthase n=1 Tax=Erysipelothrix larvae TaxID=1514105 RepID=A0A0X8H1P4_9FIRM|nr:glutathionylspermidine synthase family protein [Erysipelothrix larvae]AMC94400.1 glutathionylspermidine synthase [Erysipelothrix larvae]